MAPRVPPRLRRVLAALVAIAALAVLIGATYQGVATALERHRYSRPGGLVDAGGHQLHIYCLGTGTPTVVLEAAAGSMSSAWSRVQPEVARTTRVCSYDRSGLGWSEAGDGVYDPSRVPGELRTLLEHANEPGPFVVVGQELGAAFARMFGARYGGDVAALVLVNDPASTPSVPAGALVAAWPWLARAGLLRATGHLSSRASGLPGESGGAMRAFLNRPDHLTRAAQELLRADEVVRAATEAAHAGPGPPVVSVMVESRLPPAMLVTKDDATRVIRAIQSALSTLEAADGR